MEALLQALAQIATPTYWIALTVAISVGTVVGFIPGVGATLVTAIMLPSVLFLVEEPAIGIMLIAMIGSLNNTLDSIPAVLVGVPGSETQVTYLEGHQLARKGQGAHTLGAIYAVSAIGGIVGAIILALSIPVIKPVILKFSYAEIAMLAIFGIAMVALLSRGSMAKGLAAGALGLLIGTIGVDPFSGADRYTLGYIELWQGLPVITVILGFFALPELIDLTMSRQSVAGKDTTVSRAEVFRGFRYGLSRWRMVIRQSIFGVLMGAIPGIGGSVVDWLAYAFGISMTKDKEKHNFGKGSLEGVLFAESAANSKAGGQALPTLTLGIPGSTSWAIIAVAIVSYGLFPGPSMVSQNMDVTMLIVITLALGNLIVALLGLFFTNWLARITRVPYPTVGFLIMGMVVLAAYMDLSGGWLVFPILGAFTALGLIMKSYRWPRPPLVLGFILGPVVEKNLLSALSLYGLRGTITRPLTLGLIALIILSMYALLRMGANKPDVVALELAEAREHGSASNDDGAGMRAALTGSLAGSVTGSTDGAAGDASPRSQPAAVGLKDVRVPLVRRVLHTDNLGPLLFIVVAVAFARPAFSFNTSARTLPLAMSTLIIILAGYQLVKQTIQSHQAGGDIMDLGMQSADAVGRRSAGFLIAGLFLVSGIVAGTIGLRVAAVLLAAAGPMLFLKGRSRWTSMAISGAFVWAFSEFLMDRLIGTIWPEPFLRAFFTLG
jgi:putative tricarboxylic transport membrane protein